MTGRVGNVPLGRLGQILPVPDRIVSGGARLVGGHAYATCLRVGVYAPRDRPVVGRDVVAERQAHDHLPLVVRQVSVHLGAGRVACNPHAVGKHERAVQGQLALVELDADVLQTQAVDGHGSPDGKHDVLATDAGPVGQSNLVIAVRTGRRYDLLGPDRRTHDDTVTFEAGADGRRIGRMIAIVEAIVRVHDG